MRSKRNGNRDRTRAHSDRKSKRIESIFKDLVFRSWFSFARPVSWPSRDHPVAATTRPPPICTA